MIEFNPNKSYYLVDMHSGRGLSYEVYSNYDYIREVDGPGTKIKLEHVEGTSYKIKMTGFHWDGYNYLTRSDNSWIYLDKKEKSSNWHLTNTTDFFGISNSNVFAIYQAGQIEERYWTYFSKGSKKWLGTNGRNDAKRFKLIEAE